MGSEMARSGFGDGTLWKGYAFAPAGRSECASYTPRAMPWAGSCWPFRPELVPWAGSCWPFRPYSEHPKLELTILFHAIRVILS